MTFELIRDGQPDDPITLIPPMAADHAVAAGPVDKKRVEDLQTWQFLTALSLNGALPEHPVEILRGADPPDRILRMRSQDYALELTELTITDFRRNIARARRLGRLVQERLSGDPGSYPHLSDRVVVIADLSEDGSGIPPGTRIGDLATQVAEELKTDRGYFFEGLEGHDIARDGFPSQLPDRGVYAVAGLHVRVERIQRQAGAALQVVASATTTIAVSEARALMEQRVAAKDLPENRLLLLTTGLLDNEGFVCPLDYWIFHALVDHGIRQLAPTHLDAVVMHHWGSMEVRELYRRPGADIPWKSAPLDPKTSKKSAHPGA